MPAMKTVETRDTETMTAISLREMGLLLEEEEERGRMREEILAGKVDRAEGGGGGRAGGGDKIEGKKGLLWT